MADTLHHLFGATSDSGSDKRTLTAEAYHRLRQDIIMGRLKPGEKLRTEHLKIEYDVSAATVREALALLVADALVVSQQQRGFRVAPMSLSDFRDITQTRALLEAQAVSQSVQNGDDEWEAELSASFHLLSKVEERVNGGPEDRRSWEEANKRFHEALISAGGSRWTRHFLSILNRQSERYRTVAFQHAPPERDVHGEHGAIYAAAISRDAELAGLLVKRHIERTLDVVASVKQDGAADMASFE